jgi:hypothetical protein
MRILIPEKAEEDFPSPTLFVASLRILQAGLNNKEHSCQPRPAPLVMLHAQSLI